MATTFEQVRADTSRANVVTKGGTTVSDMLMATFGDTADQRHEPIENSATGNGIAGGARAVTDLISLE